MTIGRRVVSGTKRGTIRFIGEIPSHRGLFYGVDWDESKDGKHNGYYNGVQYFNTWHPTSGSFIKVTEVKFGNTFVDALKWHYDYDITKSFEEHADDIRQLKEIINVKSLEFIGFDKFRKLQGPLETMRVVDLSTCDVSDPGPFGEIQETCPNIRDLDLSNSLITNWKYVAMIGMQLENLNALRLNNTRINIPDNVENYTNAFLKLKELVMCKCEYNWDDIMRASVMWPHLHSLKVPLNRITTLESPVNTLQDLRVLDLFGNPISSWSEINKLGHLKRLETLNLSKMGLTEILIPPEENLFPALRTLFVADNNISSWSAMVDLNNLPSLKSLKFKRNPVMKNDQPSSYRGKIIARIRNIEILNGQEILEKERNGGEYDYLKEFSTDWYSCEYNETLKKQFLQDHPRYTELIEAHGPPDIVKPTDNTLNANLIPVKLTYVSNDGALKKSCTKKLHSSMLVYKLVAIAKRLFNIGSVQPKLTYISAANPDIKLEMENDLKPLNSYGISDGDTIMITA